MSGLPPEFRWAEQHRCELNRQLQWRALTPEQYATALHALRVVDRRGLTWQPDPASPGWLCWDGTRWQSSDPAGQQQAAAGYTHEPPGRRRRSRGLLAVACRGSRGRVPLRQRPRHWWDALSVWTGILAGLGWLAYASFNRLAPMRVLDSLSSLQLESLPALVLLLLPVLLLLARRTLLARLNLLLLRFDPWPAGVKIIVAIMSLSVTVAAGWAAIGVLQTSPTLAAWANLDLATPLILAAIPALFVLFRRETDRLLGPLARLLRPIPRFMLISLALALPLVFSYLLANVIPFTAGGLLKWNLILSASASYLLLRTPAGSPQRTGGRLPAAAGVWLAMGGMLIVELLFDEHTAWAYTYDDSTAFDSGLCTCSVARAQAAAAAELGVIGTAGGEIARNLSGAAQTPEPADRTRLLSGGRALEWLRANGFLDGNNRFTAAFQSWYERLPADESPSDLNGVAGVFDPAAGTVPGALTIAVTDRRTPTAPANHLTHSAPVVVSPPAAAEQLTPPEPETNAPPVTGPPPRRDTVPPVTPVPPPEATTPPVEPPPPVQPVPPPAPPPPPVHATEPAAPIPIDNQPDLDDLNLLAGLQSTQADLIRCAGYGGGVSLGDISRWLHKQGDRIRAPFEWIADWYKNDWLKTCEQTQITEKHRLPERIVKHGLYDTSRESLLQQGVRQSIINAGVKPEVADEVLKRVEAEGAEDAQMARLATKLLRSVRALHQGAQAGVEGGLSSGAAAAGHDVIGPDPTAIVERMALAQQSNYQHAVDRWRDTQDTARWVQTGAGVTSPQSTQDVDRLLSDLRQDQRLLKKQLGYDMDRMRDSADMRQMWREEQALKDLRRECADLNVLRRARGR
ncbi:hypothetical protein JW859_13875 [bacterium]|nr:hypothetical protein [bacterium]